MPPLHRATFATVVLATLTALDSVAAGGAPVWSDLHWLGGFGQLRTTFKFDVNSDFPSGVSLVVTSLGCNELFLDGLKLGNGELEPGFSTVPTTRVLYTTHDVTAALTSAGSPVGAPVTHALGVRLGSCKYGWMNTYCNGTAVECIGFKLQFVDSATGARVPGGPSTASATGWTGAVSPWAPSGKAYPDRTLWDGAKFNHSLEQPGWDTASFAAKGWRPAVKIVPTIDPPFISPSTIPPMTRHPPAGIAPVALWSVAPGVYVADFNTNMAGYVTISLPAVNSAPPTTITAMHGELITGPNGTVTNQYMVPPHNADDCAHYGSCAFQTDSYFLPSGSRLAMVLEPAFTYHGFRFVEIHSSLPITAEMLKAYFLYTDVEQTGHFSSKSAVLNGIQKMIVQTVLSNLQSLPSDCPTREKRGWMGDAQWSSENNVANFDMATVYGNWHRTIGDAQVVGCIHGSKSNPPPAYCLKSPIDGAVGTPASPSTWSPITATAAAASPNPCALCCDAAVTNKQRFGCYSTAGLAGASFANASGSVPGVVPFDNVAGWPADPAWGAAAVVIPHAVWKQTGNAAAAAAAYPIMARYVEFLLAHVTGRGLVEFGMLGDWNTLNSNGSPATKRLFPGSTPPPQVAAFYGVLCLDKVAEVAAALSRAGDAKRYAGIASDMRAAYHAAFFRTSTGTYQDLDLPGGECAQTANVLPLVLGVVPKEEVPRVWSALNASLYCVVGSSGPSMTTGGVGTRYIFEALTAIGQEAVALTLAQKQTMPSFGYMVAQGPGTAWEQWDGDRYHPGGDPTRGGGVSSKNHHMFTGGIGMFLYKTVAGISTDIDTATPSGRRITVRPLMEVMARVRAATATIRGPASVPNAGKEAAAADAVTVAWDFQDDTTVGDGDGVRSVWRVNVTRPAGLGSDAAAPVWVHVPLGGRTHRVCARSVVLHAHGDGQDVVLWQDGASQVAHAAVRRTTDGVGRNVLEVPLSAVVSDRGVSSHAGISVAAVVCSS